MDIKGYLMISICISLIINDVKYLAKCLLDIHIFFLEVSVNVFCYFSLSFYYWVVLNLLRVPSNFFKFQIFFQFLRFSFGSLSYNFQAGTCRQANSPNVHISGMWEETGVPREPRQTWGECANYTWVVALDQNQFFFFSSLYNKIMLNEMFIFIYRFYIHIFYRCYIHI